MRAGVAGAWENVRTLWRRYRRRGGAFAVALTLNALIIAGFIASSHVARLPDGKVIIVTLVRPFDFQRAKPPPRTKALAPATQSARVHAATPVSTAQTPPPAPLPATPKPAATPDAPANHGRWTATPDLHSQLVDQPSAQRYMRAGSACSKGELWKLTQEEQAKCLVRFGSKVPPDDGMHHHPPPNDPGREFASEIERREERARSMQQAPLGQCEAGTMGSNLHRVCHDGGPQ